MPAYQFFATSRQELQSDTRCLAGGADGPTEPGGATLLLEPIGERDGDSFVRRTEQRRKVSCRVCAVSAWFLMSDESGPQGRGTARWPQTVHHVCPQVGQIRFETCLVPLSAGFLFRSAWDQICPSPNVLLLSPAQS